MPQKSVVIFDFDHTLITGDSFWPFLVSACGRLRVAAALVRALLAYALRGVPREVSGDDAAPTDFRTFIKDRLIRGLLTGKRVGQLADAAARTRHWQKLNLPVFRALQDFQARGFVIVIASGGLGLYLPECLRDMPHHALICTDVGVENGVVTGVMTQGNCVRLGKAARVAKWLAANGPFDESWAYGNYPHDVPMMNLVKHRIIVS